jgi:hypothetical protein
VKQTIESNFPSQGFAPAPSKDGIEPHLRFADLKRLGICPDWDTLQDWVERRGFPVGIKVSRKWRIWPSSSIQRWLDAQARGA